MCGQHHINEPDTFPCHMPTTMAEDDCDRKMQTIFCAWMIGTQQRAHVQTLEFQQSEGTIHESFFNQNQTQIACCCKRRLQLCNMQFVWRRMCMLSLKLFHGFWKTGGDFSFAACMILNSPVQMIHLAQDTNQWNFWMCTMFVGIFSFLWNSSKSLQQICLQPFLRALFCGFMWNKCFLSMMWLSIFFWHWWMPFWCCNDNTVKGPALSHHNNCSHCCSTNSFLQQAQFFKQSKLELALCKKRYVPVCRNFNYLNF